MKKRLVALVLALCCVLCVFASCTVDRSPEKFTVTVIVDGQRTETQYDKGHVLTLEDPEKDGHIFLGFFDEDGNVVTFPFDVTEDVTLTARFDAVAEMTELEKLEASLKRYLNSPAFKYSLVSTTMTDRLPKMYLKYVKGSLFDEEQMQQITAYMDMLAPLQDQSGSVDETKWQSSAAEKQGWKSLTDYLLTWSSQYVQYRQYCHANGLTPKSKYVEQVDAILAYVRDASVYNIDRQQPEYYLARWQAEETAQENGELTYRDRVHKARPTGLFSASPGMYNYNAGPKTFINKGFLLQVLQPAAEALCGSAGAGDFAGWKVTKWQYNYNTLCELFPDKKQAMDDWFVNACDTLENWDADTNGPLYQKKNYVKSYHPVINQLHEDFVRIFEPTSKSVSFGFSYQDALLLIACDLDADVEEYAAWSVKGALSKYEKDENGNYTHEPQTPNWVGFTSSPLVASVLRDNEKFDLVYEKSVQYYFPDHDTGMSGVKPEERVTLDRLAKEPQVLSGDNSGSGRYPQYMWLTAMAMGVDLRNYVPSTGGEAVDMIQMWLDSLIKDKNGLYAISADQDAAMMIGYICLLKGVQAPSPFGAWSPETEIIEL